MRTPDFKDRLSAASAAKKAQIERARAIAEDPERLKRIEARSEIIAARNRWISEREREKRETMAREAAERAAAEAAEAAVVEAIRKAEEEARKARLVEQARLEAAAAASRAVERFSWVLNGKEIRMLLSTKIYAHIRPHPQNLLRIGGAALHPLRLRIRGEQLLVSDPPANSLLAILLGPNALGNRGHWPTSPASQLIARCRD